MKTANNTNVADAPMGLRQRLRTALSLAELGLLLQEGQRYKHASDVTKAAWHRTAERRRKELGA